MVASLTDADEQAVARVGVVGYITAKDLFGESPEAMRARRLAKPSRSTANNRLKLWAYSKQNGGPYSTDKRLCPAQCGALCAWWVTSICRGAACNDKYILLGLQSEQDTNRAAELINAALRDLPRDVPASAIDDFRSSICQPRRSTSWLALTAQLPALSHWWRALAWWLVALAL
ncbi:MAG: hypothetical protein U0074_05640 [Kouleothrix sp.]